MRTLAAAAAVLALLVVTGCTVGGGATSPSETGRSKVAEAAGRLVAPTDFRSSLEHASTARPDALVEWRSDWVLRWSEVPGARGYVVRFATSEGRGGRERRLDRPELRLDVAAGTSRRARLTADREAQLTLAASQLLVAVAAVDAAGATGPASPWYRVGETGKAGKPVPNNEPGEH